MKCRMHVNPSKVEEIESRERMLQQIVQLVVFVMLKRDGMIGSRLDVTVVSLRSLSRGGEQLELHLELL